MLCQRAHYVAEPFVTVHRLTGPITLKADHRTDPGPGYIRNHICIPLVEGRRGLHDDCSAETCSVRLFRYIECREGMLKYTLSIW